MAVKLQAPVTSRKVDAAGVQGMREAVGDLQPGEFASDGETYSERSKASSMASTYLSLLGIRETHRARTWEAAPGAWVFGIAPRPPKRETKPRKNAPAK